MDRAGKPSSQGLGHRGAATRERLLPSWKWPMKKNQDSCGYQAGQRPPANKAVGWKGTEEGTWEALKWLDTVVYNHGARV